MTTPRIGQTWASNDRRDVTAGRCQRLRVIGMTDTHVRFLNELSGRLTSVAIRRLRPTSTGYRLVLETP